MMYVLASLAGLAGLFYGLWQRARASRAVAERGQMASTLDTHLRVSEDRRRRLEAVITDLKARLIRAEEESLANASPDDVRRRLGELLSPDSDA